MDSIKYNIDLDNAFALENIPLVDVSTKLGITFFVDKDFPQYKDMTIIQYAIAKRKPKTLKLLIHKAKESKMSDEDIMYPKTSNTKGNLFDLAIEFGSKKFYGTVDNSCLHIIIENFGIDESIHKNDESPLNKAILYQNDEAFELLLNNKADIFFPLSKDENFIDDEKMFKFLQTPIMVLFKMHDNIKELNDIFDHILKDKSRNIIDRLFNLRINNNGIDIILDKLELHNVRIFITEKREPEIHCKSQFSNASMFITEKREPDNYCKSQFSNHDILEPNNIQSKDNIYKNELVEHGDFGDIFTFKNGQNNQFMEKIFHLHFDDYSKEEKNKIMNDISISMKINHPSICKCIDFYHYGFKDEKNPVIFYEYMKNNSLFDILSEKNGITGWNDTKKLINIYGIALGMSYLHSLDILHKNLNTKNILENDQFYPKISSLFVKHDFRSIKSMAKIIENSPFDAPELYINNEYTKASEVYSFGLIVYSIYTNKNLYNHLNDHQILIKIIEENLPKLDESIPKAYRELIEICLSKNPENRPTFDVILQKLQNDPEFITNSVDTKQFEDYIKYTKSFIINDKLTKSFIKEVSQTNPDKKKSTPKSEEDKQPKKRHKTDDSHQLSKNPKRSKKSKIEEEEEINDDDDDLKIEEEEEEEEEEDDEYADEESNEEIENEMSFNFLQNITTLSLKNLQQLNRIKKGEFSNVYLVQDKISKNKYAAKVLKIQNIDKFIDSPIGIEFVREITCHSQVHHPAIVTFIGYNRNYFHHNERSVIFTQYHGRRNLEDILLKERKGKKIKNWNDTQKLIFIYGIANGMKYLHSKDILHRDLNPSNIIVDELLFPKICGFKLSKKISDIDDVMENNHTKSYIVGTMEFIAPEIFSNQKYSKASDVYSFGILVYSILAKTLPFENSGSKNVMYRVLIKNERPKRVETINNKYWELIQKCWSTNPSERPTFEDIVNQLGTNTDFITKKIDVKAFNCYKNSFMKF